MKIHASSEAIAVIKIAALIFFSSLCVASGQILTGNINNVEYSRHLSEGNGELGSWYKVKMKNIININGTSTSSRQAYFELIATNDYTLKKGQKIWVLVSPDGKTVGSNWRFLKTLSCFEINKEELESRGACVINVFEKNGKKYSCVQIHAVDLKDNLNDGLIIDSCE